MRNRETGGQGILCEKVGNRYRKCFFRHIRTQKKDDDRAQQDYRKIAIFPAQLRHIFEIHAVPATISVRGRKMVVTTVRIFMILFWRMSIWAW